MAGYMLEGEEIGATSIQLRGLAETVARECGDKGAVVATYGRGGIRTGPEGLTPQELREALCTAIHYSCVMEERALQDKRES